MSESLYNELQGFTEAQVRSIDGLINEGVACEQRLAELTAKKEQVGAELGKALHDVFQPNQRSMSLSRPTGQVDLTRNVEVKLDKKKLVDRKAQLEAVGFQVVEQTRDAFLRPDMIDHLRQALGPKRFAEIVNLKLAKSKAKKLAEYLGGDDRARVFTTTKATGDPKPTKTALEALDGDPKVSERVRTELRRVIAFVEKPATATFKPPVAGS